jgi:hypothetical protein
VGVQQALANSTLGAGQALAMPDNVDGGSGGLVTAVLELALVSVDASACLAEVPADLTLRLALTAVARSAIKR